ncbi:lytic murein transglycosylase [Syntrophomonas palmitatica]|uniref:lytic murein transglycosylase n=1 Tax=Syntrophomonas palmitatica TaxID=402877 RepID=UPI0006D0EE97|nr:lytic murein transglycosylase [Syntrophomonas palmitatica]
MNNFIKNAIKKKIFKLLLPFLPIILVILLVCLIILTIYGATFSGSPVAGGDTDMNNTIDTSDKQVIEKYKNFANNWNIWDTWLVMGDSNPDINPFLDKYRINTEHIKKNIWLDIEQIQKHNEETQELEDIYNVHSLIDRDGKDKELVNNWGSIQSYISWWMYQHSETIYEIPDELFEEFIKEMHPKFKYRTSVRTVCSMTKDGCKCSSITEYLLTEADTMRGHFKYEYEWYTEPATESDPCPDTYEVLKNTIDISPNNNRWEKLEQWLVEHYEIPQEDAQDIRLSYINAETAFKEQTEVIEWMLQSDPFIMPDSIPLGSIPFNIQELCKQASEKFGIPAELLMAIAQKETGGTFNPTAYNTNSGATGLMQFMPSTWEVNKVDGDGDGVCNIYSPADAIFSAANYLKNLSGRNLDLKEDKDWIIKILSQYGGNPLTEAAKNYATAVYATATNFLQSDIIGISGYVFPLQGLSVNNINSKYEMRFHPTLKIWRFHTGVDIPAKSGTLIYAVCGGRVYSAGWLGGGAIPYKL